MQQDPLLCYLDGKSILILGFGREGKSSLSFILKHREKLHIPGLAIADRNEINLDNFLIEPSVIDDLSLKTYSGDDYLDAILSYDLVLKSPGISLKAYTTDTIKAGVLAAWPNSEISGQIDLFLRFTKIKNVIGITGTKGKSTTSSLTAHILENSGRNTYLAGNIGIPILDRWDEYSESDYMVVELSSHQLQFVQASPRLAAITNFYPEHLDHYVSYDEYLNSKLNIIRYQDEDGFFVLNEEDQELCKRSRDLIRGHVQRISMKDGLTYRGLNPHLMGDHHAVDVALAAALCERLALSDEEIRAGISSFQGMPHRCEYLGEFDGIKFYNDSIATIPQATLFAIETLHDVDTLIVGGMDRGLDYSHFIEELAGKNIPHILCLPETGTMLYEALEKKVPGRAVKLTELSEAVKMAFQLTEKGKSCLLSPAASSYHHWRSFEERGDEFRTLVHDFS